MSPRSVGESNLRQLPLLRADEPVRSAVRRIIDTEVPALPVIDADERLVGIFGEREFIAAIFPGYVKELHYAGFVTKATDELLEKNAACAAAPVSRYMNTEHIDLGPDYSDASVAETFMHHRVLIVPITDNGKVLGVVTRWDFFRVLGELLLERDRE